ncbi:MAG: NUDIX domain-containing protein, partial [Clostridiales Family XIII bacterium]|nr:NUDIX domain-containing protein [Clostridiales Family XIII bacterium]
LVCAPIGSPACSLCPLSPLCKACNNGIASELPVRSKKKPKREETVTVLILSCGNDVAIRRRPDKGLLAGMWELPNILHGKTAPSAGNHTAGGAHCAQAAIDLAAAWGTEPVSVLKVVRRTHVFTHIKWDMTGYCVECLRRSEMFTWAGAEALADVYALPAAFRQFVAAGLSPVPPSDETKSGGAQRQCASGPE